MSDASAVPTVRSLLDRLVERDAQIARLEARLAERDAVIAGLRTEVDSLVGKVATLEDRVRKNSQNSSNLTSIT